MVSVLTESCDWRGGASRKNYALHSSAAGLEKYRRRVSDERPRSGCMRVLLADGWNLAEAVARARSVLSYACELTSLLSASCVGQLVDVLQDLRDHRDARNSDCVG